MVIVYTVALLVSMTVTFFFGLTGGLALAFVVSLIPLFV
jgi:hypothetical protein